MYREILPLLLVISRLCGHRETAVNVLLFVDRRVKLSISFVVGDQPLRVIRSQEVEIKTRC